LSDKFEWLPLPDVNYNFNGNTNYGMSSLHINKSSHNIPSFTLDSMEVYLRKPLSFIKMDLEGYELIALRGGLKIITKYKPVILIEIWNANVDFFKASNEYKYLESIGYKLNHIKDDDYFLSQ